MLVVIIADGEGGRYWWTMSSSESAKVKTVDIDHKKKAAWMTDAKFDPASSTTKPAQAELMYVGLTRFFVPCLINMNNK